MQNYDGYDFTENYDERRTMIGVILLKTIMGVTMLNTMKKMLSKKLNILKFYKIT
jgi:hypothetical protein